jgi:hypothetical protein
MHTNVNESKNILDNDRHKGTIQKNGVGEKNKKT